MHYLHINLAPNHGASGENSPDRIALQP